MTVIRPNSIAGITSLTALGGSIDFYNASGAGIQFNNVNLNNTSGVSTFSSINATGIVTATSFSGNINSSGVSTFNNINATGIVTATSFSGNINSSGVSTITTLRATNITGVSTIGVTTAYVTNINDGPISGVRNRVINGDMRVDQRNNGASVTVTGDGFANRAFPVDRFNIQKTSSCTITGIQTSDVPSNNEFSYAIRAGVSSADASIAAGDNAFIAHRFEGFNVSDLNFGTSSAKNLTLSFWVKSSIAGTYCVGFSNYADNRSRPVEYTISSTNTWEYKTITISADTSGTWEKTNSGGLNVTWMLGAGSTYQGTNNTWQAGISIATSNQTQWISTLNATFFLTGVQLEVGTVATPFERRSFGQELALCQRYYEKSYNVDTTPGSSTDVGLCVGYYNATNGINQKFNIRFSVAKRATPSITGYDAAGNSGKCSAFAGGNARTDNLSTASRGISQIGTQSFNFNEADLGTYYGFGTHWVASIEL